MIGKQSQKKKYPLVNWADGMPVNKGHFTQQEDHFTDRLCEYRGLTETAIPTDSCHSRGKPVCGNFSITELVTGTLEVQLKRSRPYSGGCFIMMPVRMTNSPPVSISYGEKRTSGGMSY